MKKIILNSIVICSIISCVFLAGCGSTDYAGPNMQDPPAKTDTNAVKSLKNGIIPNGESRLKGNECAKSEEDAKIQFAHTIMNNYKCIGKDSTYTEPIIEDTTVESTNKPCNPDNPPYHQYICRATVRSK